jgi:hypothetical protein
MLELKQISKQAIPRALAKAERYRLLNEPHEAESICRDVLRAEPGNQEAVVALVLALTDQFGSRHGADMGKARQALAQLTDEYERAYYGGIIYERWAKAQFEAHVPTHLALDWVEEAMSLYESAEALRPGGNDDAVLRWNSCLRFIESARLAPKSGETGHDAGFTDESPASWAKRTP